MTTLRHYGKFKNEEVVVLGYRKLMNSVMICRTGMLPADEQAQLRQIASSSYAQSNCDYLIPVLRNERHKSGSDWFTYLANRLHRNDGSVAVLPLKEIEDMEVDQKAFFKGWGNSIAEAKTNREDQTTNPNVIPKFDGEELKDYKPLSPIEATVLPNETQAPVTAVDVPNISAEEAKPYVDRDAMMLQLMQKMADGQEKIADSIAGLEKKIAPRKTTRKRTTAKKKVAAKPAVKPVAEKSAPAATPEG